jgi:hypothetical protein
VYIIPILHFLILRSRWVKGIGKSLHDMQQRFINPKKPGGIESNIGQEVACHSNLMSLLYKPSFANVEKKIQKLVIRFFFFFHFYYHWTIGLLSKLTFIIKRYLCAICAKIVLLHVECLICNLMLINIKCVWSFGNWPYRSILENITAWQQRNFLESGLISHM